MKKFTIASIVAGGVVAAAAGVFAASHAVKDVELAFPADYKTTFSNYFTGDRQNGKQIISIYANDIAMKGAQTDGRLPYGSILIGELTPAVTDEEGDPLESSLGHLISSNKVAKIVMMQRIEGNDARYGDDLKVGDWEFEVFSASGENLGKDTTACRECHHPLTDTEFMWSIEHLTQKVSD